MVKWSKLSRTIPWHPQATASLHSISTVIAESKRSGARVAVKQPGVHSGETGQIHGVELVPRLGGDFVIEIKDPAANWDARRFRHVDLFADFNLKAEADRSFVKRQLAPALIRVVGEGADPLEPLPAANLPGLQIGTLLVASQCLALCEHRRFAQFEPVGGRALPARYVLGIIWEVWSIGEAIRVEHSGRRGLLYLREQHGREPAFSTVLGRDLTSDACREERDR